MAIHEHWTHNLPSRNKHTSELSKAIEGDTEHLSNLLDRVDTVLEQRIQRVREAGFDESSGYSIDQIEQAKALAGRVMVQGSLRAANVLHHEARFMMTSTSEVTERLVDVIAEKTLELIKLLKELEGTCDSLQLIAKTPHS